MLWSLIKMTPKFKLQDRQGTRGNTERGKSSFPKE